MGQWKFLSNHGAVLAYLAKHPRALAVDIAAELGVRERTVRRVIADLDAEGYIEKKRIGRSNKYKVRLKAPLKRPIMRQGTVGDLLKKLVPLIEIRE
jgi:predicted ArsR family transcriptional regulator